MSPSCPPSILHVLRPHSHFSPRLRALRVLVKGKRPFLVVDDFLRHVGAADPMNQAKPWSWDRLPLHLQLRILEEVEFSLSDLARLASLGKPFYVWYHMRAKDHAADEERLAAAAISVYGVQLVELLVSLLSAPMTPNNFNGAMKFDLTLGQPWPRADELFGLIRFLLITPSWGPLADRGLATITWESRRVPHPSSDFALLVVHADDINGNIVIGTFQRPSIPGQLLVGLPDITPDLALPLMGLALLATKELSRNLNGFNPIQHPPNRIVDRQEIYYGMVNLRSFCSKVPSYSFTRWTCGWKADEISWVSEEVKSALDVLTTTNAWRRGRRIEAARLRISTGPAGNEREVRTFSGRPEGE
jgi:hypothetical protein